MNKANLNPRIARWTLALQNYSFRVVHRPGTKMHHVDALSRAVAHINEMPLERELEFRQIADQRLRQISEELEFNDNDKFSLVNGLVYKKHGEDLKFAVPVSMVFNVLRAHHDDAGHCGKEKTYQSIIRNYWFPTMRKRVYDYVDNCFKCIMSNDSTNRFEKELSLYPLPTVPMNIIHIDHFGPLQETEQRYKHVLVIVDSFTRFTWLRAVKSTTSRETIEHLRNIFSEYGNPTTIVIDRGTAFTSKEFALFISQTLIKHRLVAVAAPWANGLVERVNRFLKSLLTKLSDSPIEWKNKLAEAQYIINNTYHSTIKSTPSKLMFGFDLKSHADYHFAQFTRDLTEIDNDLETQRIAARDTASTATELIRTYNKMYSDSLTRKPTLYKKGDYILIRDSRSTVGESTKLKPKYKGPYMIEKCLGNNRYVVTDIPGFNVASRPLNTILSSDRIKHWIKKN